MAADEVSMTQPIRLDEARRLLAAAEDLVERALERTRGAHIDDHQVLVERVTYAATQSRAAREMLAALDVAKAEGRTGESFEQTGVAAIALLCASVRELLETV